MSPQSIITEVIPHDIQTSHKWVIPGHTTYLTESLNATMLGLWSSLVTWRHGGHWDHFTDDFSMLFIFYGNLICCSSNSNELIPTNFCTWHDSSAVMSCAKICRDMITKNGITAKQNLCWILIMMGKLLVKRTSARLHKACHGPHVSKWLQPVFDAEQTKPYNLHDFCHVYRRPLLLASERLHLAEPALIFFTCFNLRPILL